MEACSGWYREVFGFGGGFSDTQRINRIHDHDQGEAMTDELCGGRQDEKEPSLDSSTCSLSSLISLSQYPTCLLWVRWGGVSRLITPRRVFLALLKHGARSRRSGVDPSETHDAGVVGDRPDEPECLSARKHCRISTASFMDVCSHSLRSRKRVPLSACHRRSQFQILPVLESMGIWEKLAAFHSPWQNGAVEKMNATLSYACSPTRSGAHRC